MYADTRQKRVSSMQKIINRILEGNFDYEGGGLDFSCANVEIALPAGSLYEGSFCINSPAGRFIEGYVTVSDLRMECLTPEFSGNDVEISFCFHGENMEEGEVVKGSFFVVSNQGEYYLPFVAEAEYAAVDSSAGVIKNLFHFANLAKSSWQEAVNLFYSPDFEHILEESDPQYLDVYRGLSAYGGWEQNVEEFLIHVDKKQKNQYTVKEQEIVMELPGTGNSYSVWERELSVVRKGWGYTRLQVECEGDFLFTEKEILTDDDFLGNCCSLPVFIDGSLCHCGKNFGQVCLYNSYVSVLIPVTVRVNGGMKSSRGELARKRTVVHIMDFYQAFRLKKISRTTWLAETGKLVETLVALDGKNPAARLFQAQLMITEERYHEAGWLLEHVAEQLKGADGDGTLRAYYLYLTTLLNRDEKYVEKAEAQVRQIYRQDVSNWRTAWLLLYLSQELNRSASGKWVFLEKQFERGCTSPVLYIEALLLVNHNPTLLRRLGGFELQVLWYGVRKQTLAPEAAEQLLYLSGRVKEFSPVLFQILSKLHETRPDERVLQEICTLLIKGGKAGPACFSWYKAGVEAQLRITNLYEYFMMSLDLRASQPLPKMVLLYFSYQNNLDFAHRAYLYDYILQNRNQLEDLYASYRARMERFVVEQIQKAHMNRNLANLYREFITPDIITPQLADSLARLLFAWEIRTKDEGMKRVFVYQPGNLQPMQYTLVDGCAWIALYGTEYTIVLEDAWGNRFTKSADYTLERMMEPGSFLPLITPYVKDCMELDLYLSAKDGWKQETREDTERALRITGSGQSALWVKRELYLKILRHYYDTDQMRLLDEYLCSIPAENLTWEGRREVFRYMALRGSYSLAHQWLSWYGPCFADAKVLLRVLGPLIEENQFLEEPVLTKAAEYVFDQGKYDGIILSYLTLYYKGLTQNMRDIWKAAISYEVDCYKLSERILLQMLYSGSFVEEKMEIFRYYVSQGAKKEVEEAFLAQCAYDYFVKDRETQEYVFREIRNMYLRKEEVQKVCRLAWLKFYAADSKSLEEGEKEMAKAFLETMKEEHIHLDFLRSYSLCGALSRDMADKTIVEYHTRPGGRACIHYVIVDENGESGEYRREYMREVCGGVCFAEFVLFFGETLQYYITEEKGGEEQFSQSGSLQKKEGQEGAQDGSFRLINEILTSKNLKEYDALDGLLEEYYSREYYNSGLFSLI